MNSPVGSPAMSAVTGKVLSRSTQAGYAADWALFTDWCTATNHAPLPADWPTVLAFTAGCPGAPATIRRRLAAIAHHHRAAGHPAPADPAPKVVVPSREPVDPGQVDMLMRLLPSHGWIGGLFGRRDRALLTLAAATTIPYRQLPRLTVAQLHITDGTATVTDHLGTAHVIEAAEDPVLCGPCTLVRWRRVLDTEVTHKRVKKLLKDAEEVTSDSHHSCQAPKPFDDRTLDAPLLPPINQWGQLPYPLAEPALHFPPGPTGRHRPRPPPSARRRRGRRLCWRGPGRGCVGAGGGAAGVRLGSSQPTQDRRRPAARTAGRRARRHRSPHRRADR